jgi:hypothetical protein
MGICRLSHGRVPLLGQHSGVLGVGHAGGRTEGRNRNSKEIIAMFGMTDDLKNIETPRARDDLQKSGPRKIHHR